MIIHRRDIREKIASILAILMSHQYNQGAVAVAMTQDETIDLLANEVEDAG